jgi:hypothetical protein
MEVLISGSGCCVQQNSQPQVSAAPALRVADNDVHHMRSSEDKP